MHPLIRPLPYCFALFLGSHFALQCAFAFQIEKIEPYSLSVQGLAGSQEPSFSVKTKIAKMSWLAFLNQKPGGKPWILVSGRTCESCPEEEGLFLINPETGTHSAFIYPGKIYDSKAGTHVLNSRLFYGKCLKNSESEGVVVFNKEQLERKRWKRWSRYFSSSVFMAQLDPEKLVEKLAEKHLPGQEATLKRVKKKECFEVAGKDRKALSRPMDLILKPDIEEDEKDEDEEESKDETKDPAPKEVKEEKAATEPVK